MAALQYFLETDKRSLDLAAVRGLGLGHAFDRDRPPVCCPFDGAGPGKTQGLVLSDNDARIGYYPERQTWRRIPKRQLTTDLVAWVGLWHDARPTPQDLARRELLAGHAVRLKDDQDWLVPVARAWTDEGFYNALPGTLGLDDDGEWFRGEMDPRYERIWTIATSWWDTVHQQPVAEGELRFDFAGGIEAAIDVLAVNYRLGRAEVALLGLLDDRSYLVGEILQALVDWRTWNAWLKKKLDGGAAG